MPVSLLDLYSSWLPCMNSIATLVSLAVLPGITQKAFSRRQKSKKKKRLAMDLEIDMIFKVVLFPL